MKDQSGIKTGINPCVTKVFFVTSPTKGKSGYHPLPGNFEPFDISRHALYHSIQRSFLHITVYLVMKYVEAC